MKKEILIIVKSESYIIANDAVKVNTCLRIKDLVADGKTEVVIRNAGNKSSRQRGFEWLLYEAIAKSGKGGKHEDEKNGVHLVCKYRFAVPILLRDDSFFADIWNIYKQLYGNDTERMEWFVQNQVHTEKLTVSQMAEYLTELINYYTSKGFELPEPSDLKLLMYEELNGK